MSVSIHIKPTDSRCRFWGKLIRAEQSPLPSPSDVRGANDIPGAYIRGEEELCEGDMILTGEANHHRRTDRGWTYNIGIVHGDELVYVEVSAETKAAIKALGASTDLLKGAGECAAMVRIAHAYRLFGAELIK